MLIIHSLCPKHYFLQGGLTWSWGMFKIVVYIKLFNLFNLNQEIMIFLKISAA